MQTLYFFPFQLLLFQYPSLGFAVVHHSLLLNSVLSIYHFICMFSLTKFFADQLNCFTKVFSVPGRAQQTRQLQEINYTSDSMVRLLFLRAMPSFLHINYESALGFLFHKPDTTGVNLGTIVYATPKKYSLIYKACRKIACLETE